MSNNPIAVLADDVRQRFNIFHPRAKRCEDMGDRLVKEGKVDEAIKFYKLADSFNGYIGLAHVRREQVDRHLRIIGPSFIEKIKYENAGQAVPMGLRDELQGKVRKIPPDSPDVIPAYTQFGKLTNYVDAHGMGHTTGDILPVKREPGGSYSYDLPHFDAPPMTTEGEKAREAIKNRIGAAMKEIVEG